MTTDTRTYLRDLDADVRHELIELGFECQAAQIALAHEQRRLARIEQGIQHMLNRSDRFDYRMQELPF